MDSPQVHLMQKGDNLPTGLASITVEKHKQNFLLQHGTFEDKPQQNISKWLAKATKYQEAHMIQSLEMGAIVVHCIKGEPKTKVRRMLDVSGTKYPHADHFSDQPLQKAQAYQPYKPAHKISATAMIEVGMEALGTVGAIHPHRGADVEAVPVVQPIREQPKVEKEHCLKAYLLEIYKKKINLEEATKFLNSFKKQKSKQTCSNFLDEFALSYDRFSYMRWSNDDLSTNIEAREKEMIQLAFDGICKEFKTHVDNTKVDVSDFSKLEDQVLAWQRNTTTGKAFTSDCNPATYNAQVSALDSSEQTLDQKFAVIDLQSNSHPISAATLGNQNRFRGTSRGNSRGRGRGRGRGAVGSASGSKSLRPTGPTQSRDAQDGGHMNYRQSQDGNLHKSPSGHPLCNYCGVPSHKRELCAIKIKDRKDGLTRVFHPERDANTSKAISKAVAAAASPTRWTTQNDITSATTSSLNPTIQPNNNQFQWSPWNPPPFTPNQVQFQPNFQTAMATGHNGQQNSQGQFGFNNLKNTNQGMDLSTNNVASTSAVMETPEACPYQSCNAILHSGQYAQDHMKMFHSLAKGPGGAP